jgi:hypothetical protein
MTKRNDLEKMEFGRLVVVSYAGSKGGRAYWNCSCSCGNSTSVAAGHLIGGRIRSCGCLKHDEQIARNTKHGMANSVTYRTWANMIQRCTNQNNKDFKDYGARGITVCDKWAAFDAFLEDMGERPEGATIDREDNNGNYDPSNCRWATLETQSKNKRTTRRIEFSGVTKTLSEWAESLGMKSSSLHYRLNKYPVDVALTEPRRNYK